MISFGHAYPRFGVNSGLVTGLDERQAWWSLKKLAFFFQALAKGVSKKSQKEIIRVGCHC